MKASNPKVHIDGKYGEFLGVTADDYFKFIDCDGFVYNLTNMELNRIEIIDKPASLKAEDMSRHMDLLAGKFNSKALQIDESIRVLLNLELHKISTKQ